MYTVNYKVLYTKHITQYREKLNTNYQVLMNLITIPRLSNFFNQDPKIIINIFANIIITTIIISLILHSNVTLRVLPELIITILNVTQGLHILLQ